MSVMNSNRGVFILLSDELIKSVGYLQNVSVICFSLPLPQQLKVFFESVEQDIVAYNGN